SGCAQDDLSVRARRDEPVAPPVPGARVVLRVGGAARHRREARRRPAGARGRGGHESARPPRVPRRGRARADREDAAGGRSGTMIALTDIDHVGIAVTDLEEAVGTYERLPRAVALLCRAPRVSR